MTSSERRPNTDLRLLSGRLAHVEHAVVLVVGAGAALALTVGVLSPSFHASTAADQNYSMLGWATRLLGDQATIGWVVLGAGGFGIFAAAFALAIVSTAEPARRRAGSRWIVRGAPWVATVLTLSGFILAAMVHSHESLAGVTQSGGHWWFLVGVVLFDLLVWNPTLKDFWGPAVRAG